MSKHTLLEKRVPIEKENPSIELIEELCKKCGLCKRACQEYVTVAGHYDLSCTNDTAVCIHCGQCVTACPFNAIVEKKEYELVKDAIKDPDKVVIFSPAPAVRVALGEEFGITKRFVEGKMVSLFRKLGANYVLDVNFGADLTIMEEANELIERITKGHGPLPQYTSCCPAWVEFAETFYPDILPHLSTAKSPISMQGATIKTYFAKKMGIDPSKIVNVAIAPCTAKKFEIRRDELNSAGVYHGSPSMRDNDYVLTTKELADWAKEENIDFTALQDSQFDKLMGESSGAGMIFGNTGGVMEAALRTAYEAITNQPAPEQLYELDVVRGMAEVKEASFNIGELTLNVAVVYGTGNLRKFLEYMESSDKQYHFIEVMTCPGGCIGGAGQPRHKKVEMDDIRELRTQGLYVGDRLRPKRKSHENEEIIALYSEFFGKPLSELSEQLLHTEYKDRSYLLGSKPMDDEIAN